MRTLHVIDSLRVGGAERTLVELVRAGRGVGVESAVCVTRDGLDLAAELPPGTLLRTLGRRSALGVPAAFDGLRRLIGEVQPDVLHVHGRSSARLVAVGRAVGAIRTPYLLQDHYGGSWPRSRASRWPLSGSAEYVAASRRQLRDAQDAGARPERSRVIAPALDLERLRVNRVTGDPRAELAVAADVPLGVCVAGLRPEKGIDVLLDALADQPRPRCVIAVLGGCRDAMYSARCRGRIAASGLESMVRLCGERRDLASWLAVAHFAVHPARIESGPLSLIEQLAAGLPIVATRVGAVAESAERDGVSGFVDPDDPVALRAALERLLRLSPAVRRNRGRAGRDVADRLFSIERRAPEWLDAYQAAAEAPS